MSEVKKFGKEELNKTLNDVSLNLVSPVRVYLIGGLALMFYGLKESTKDLDLVFREDTQAQDFVAAIKKAGYHRKKKLDDIYIELGAQGIYSKDGENNFDIFIEQVCKGLFLTDGMIKRSKKIEMEGNLSIFIVSPEDIFLFKSITPRPSDLDDMYMLLQRDLDWDIIREEINHQPDHFKWIFDFYSRTGILEEKFQVKIPIREKIRMESELSVAICSLLEILKNRDITMKELHVVTDEEDMELLCRALELLKGRGDIKIDGNIISINNCSK